MKGIFVLANMVFFLAPLFLCITTQPSVKHIDSINLPALYSNWRKVKDQGTPPPEMNGHSSVVANNAMHVFGGCTAKGMCSKDVFSFSIL